MNQYDNKIPYQTHQNYIKNFEENGNDYDFYTFEFLEVMS
jgi:hypothetical protein